MNSLEGTFHTEQLSNGEVILKSGPMAFKIRKRRTLGPNKPELFLVAFRPFYRYLSSLYPVGKEGTYSLDIDNQGYILTLSHPTAVFAATALEFSLASRGAEA